MIYKISFNNKLINIFIKAKNKTEAEQTASKYMDYYWSKGFDIINKTITKIPKQYTPKQLTLNI
jgi:hypothetical protein